MISKTIIMIVIITVCHCDYHNVFKRLKSLIFEGQGTVNLIRAVALCGATLNKRCCIRQRYNGRRYIDPAPVGISDFIYTLFLML